MSSRESYSKNPIAATAARLAELRATTLRSNNSRAGFQLLLTLTLNDLLKQPKNTTSWFVKSQPNQKQKINLLTFERIYF